jgi:glycosyltransferase involved in cell wall biosynthesis
MNVSVVIPTLNAARDLPGILAALGRQTLRPAEVIVLDTSSTDGTAAIARAAGAHVRTIPRSEFDHGGTRNVGLTAARGEIVAYTVQDALPADASWLTHLCAPFAADPRVGVVTGRQIPRPDAAPLEKITRDFNYPAQGFRRELADLKHMGLRAAFSTDTNAAYRAAALRSVGGFPQPCIVQEDMAAAARLLAAGLILVYEPRAAIIHSHSYGLREQFQRHFDIGVFLATNRDLGPAGRPTHSALWYIGHHFRAVLRAGGASLLWAWLVDMLARGVGSIAGRHYNLVPPRLRPHLSRQKNYWRSRAAAAPSARA